MPNWCNNVVHLRHDDVAQLERAREGFLQGRLLQTFIPCPQDLLETIAGSYGDPEQQAELQLREAANLEKHGFRNWYDWSVAHWGTKWDVGSEHDTAEITDGVLTLVFDSAWSPPVDAYAALEEDCGFEIEAYYYEPGMAFCGVWEGGIDNCIEIPSTSKEAEKVIPVAINEMFDIVGSMEMWEEEEAE